MALKGATLHRMGREQYKTPDEDVSAEFDRVCHLFQMALGKPSDRVLFDSLMSEASARGLDWIQGLEYVIEQRHSSEPLEISAELSASAAHAQSPVSESSVGRR